MMLEKLDSFLLEKIEKFAHRWQRIFGQDCFWWAKIFAALYVIFLVSFGLFGTLISKMFSPILVASMGATPIISMVIFRTIRLAEKNTYKNQTCSLANEFKLILNTKRLVILLIFASVGFIWGICEYFLGTPLYIDMLCLLGKVCAGAVYYFVCCDPLRPAKSKVKQLLENFLTTTKEFLAPLPQPVPIPIPNK